MERLCSLLFAAETLALRYHTAHVRAPARRAYFEHAKKERRGSALNELMASLLRSRIVTCARDSSLTRLKRLYSAYPGAFRILRSQ